MFTRLRIHSAGMLCVLLLCATKPALVGAQTHADSVALARLIVTSALQDAQRQNAAIHRLVFVPRSANSQQNASLGGLRLLELAMDSLLVYQPATPVCPWYVGGELQPRLELVVKDPQISATQATASVMLSCSPGIMGRAGFGWVFTYRLTKTGAAWVVAEKIEVAIS